MTRPASATLAISLFVTVHGLAAAKVNFQREVRPILSDSCFLCHGPDKTTRMVGMRLDTREGAFAKRPSGSVIVPGNPKASLLYQRISADKPARLMPPPYSHKTLTAEQRETLRRWIEEGANWEEHWAYQAPVRREPPAVKDTSWARNPIDRFILAKLEAKGLAPAAEANKRTLIRRVTLDLTGLPPQPEDVEAFVADPDPKAYERLVDRLMAAPQWGEHRARYWLDAARYGDTHGIHIDNYREIWPYRDWVIRAFNANMPFDRFTTEQIAGDLLPHPTIEQRVATGFQRCNVTTNEAGVIIDEVEAIYAKDRADTIGAVYMGLTVGCATCHDHKFDPIPQKDFYALTAFFRNTTQNAMDGNVSDTPPIVVVPAAQDRARWEAIAAQEKALTAQLAGVRAGLTAPAAGAAPCAGRAALAHHRWRHPREHARGGAEPSFQRRPLVGCVSVARPGGRALRCEVVHRTAQRRRDRHHQAVLGQRLVSIPARRGVLQHRRPERSEGRQEPRLDVLCQRTAPWCPVLRR